MIDLERRLPSIYRDPIDPPDAKMLEDGSGAVFFTRMTVPECSELMEFYGFMREEIDRVTGIPKRGE